MGSDVIKEYKGTKYVFHNWTVDSRVDYEILVEQNVGSPEAWKLRVEQLQKKFEKDPASITPEEKATILDNEKKSKMFRRFVMDATFKGKMDDGKFKAMTVGELDADVYDALVMFGFSVVSMPDAKKNKIIELYKLGKCGLQELHQYIKLCGVGIMKADNDNYDLLTLMDQAESALIQEAKEEAERKAKEDAEKNKHG